MIELKISQNDDGPEYLTVMGSFTAATSGDTLSAYPGTGVVVVDVTGGCGTVTEAGAVTVTTLEFATGVTEPIT
jgi:hypothetical protein